MDSRKDFKTDASLRGKLMFNRLFHGLYEQSCINWLCYIAECNQFIWTGYNSCPYYCKKIIRAFHDDGSVCWELRWATFCGQNLGAGKYERIRKGILTSILMGWVWCVLCVITSYTIVPAFVKMLISSDNRNVIDTATLYLRVDSLLYFVTAMITIIRNSLQGIGDRLTPIISSGIELAGKVVITFTLVPFMGYWGVIVSEPIVWVLMVIPLIVQLIKNPAFARGKNK